MSLVDSAIVSSGGYGVRSITYSVTARLYVTNCLRHPAAVLIFQCVYLLLLSLVCLV